MAENEENEEGEGEPELVDEELTEVFRCSNEMCAQTAVEEVLNPAGIPAMIHNRTSHAFPAPASMPPSGGWPTGCSRPSARPPGWRRRG